MSAARAHRGGHDEDHEGGHDEGERWLVSFADMMTLLFALFMVLFSISSVNTSKLTALQKSLQDAFSGAVLSGGKSIMQTGSTQDSGKRAAAEPPLTSLTPLTSQPSTSVSPKSGDAAKKAAAETRDFQALKRRVDALARHAGLQGKVLTTVRRRGLEIQILTDRVFFDSGSATLKPEALGILDKIALVLGAEQKHPIVVEGHTDSQPIGGSQYPSNWELSGGRAAAVVRLFSGHGVLSRRLSFQGYGENEPIATNSTAGGRSKNRRVEVVLPRINPIPTR
jgi:chemotaxis protein MotB